MTLFKNINIVALTLLSFQFAQAQESVDYTIEQCRVVDQSGTLDSWYCRDSPGKIRCYAEIEFQGGFKTRVWGGCAESFTDCWWNGNSRVEACD